MNLLDLTVIKTAAHCPLPMLWCPPIRHRNASCAPLSNTYRIDPTTRPSGTRLMRHHPGHITYLSNRFIPLLNHNIHNPTSRRSRLRQSIGPGARPQHAGDGFSSRVDDVDPRDALDDSGLLEEGRVEFRGRPRGDGGVVAREFTLRRCGGGGSPEVVGGVG